MTVRNLQFVLSGQDKSASKALDRVGKKTDTLSAKLGKVGKAAAFGVAGAAAAVGGGLVAALAMGVRGASDLAESQSKVNTVFGKSSSIITKFSETAARDLGMTRQAALEAAGTFGNLFSAMGLGVKPAADMSTKLVTLATDLGSFNNAEAGEVLDALKSGLLGSAEPLQKFGVNLSAARIEAEAFAIGLVKPVKDQHKVTAAHNAIEAASLKVAEATKKYGKESLQTRQALDGRARAETALEKAMKGQKVELNAAQKAQAAYSIIMKDTKVAQGDFARTSGGLANQTKILKAQFSDTATRIGEKLLPVLTKVASYVNDEVVPKFNKLVTEFERGEGSGGELRDTVREFGAAAEDAWPHVQKLAEHTKSVIDYVVEHRTAFEGIAMGVVGYKVAMAGAAIATASVATSAPAAATGIRAAGVAAGAALGPVAALVAAFIALNHAVGGFEEVGGKGAIDKIIARAKKGDWGGVLDAAWGKGFALDPALAAEDDWGRDPATRKRVEANRAANRPSAAPGSSQDRPSPLNPAPTTYRDRRTSSLVVPPIQVSVISDERARSRNGAKPSYVP